MDDVQRQQLARELLKHCVIAHPRDVDKKHHDESGERKALPTIECHVYERVMDDDQTLIHVDIEEKRFREAISKVATTYKAMGLKRMCQYFYMDLQYTQQDDMVGNRENRENRTIAQVMKVTGTTSSVLEKPKLMLRVLRREKMPFSMFPSVSTLHDKRHLTSASFLAWQSGNIKVTLHFEEYDDSAGHHIRRIYFKVPAITSGEAGGVGDTIARTILTALRHAGLEA